MLEAVTSFRESQGRWPSKKKEEKTLNTWIIRQRQFIRKWGKVEEANIPEDVKEKLERLKRAGIEVRESQKKEKTEESLEKLEEKRQALIQKKQKTSGLLKEYEKLQEMLEDKGVEK